MNSPLLDIHNFKGNLVAFFQIRFWPKAKTYKNVLFNKYKILNFDLTLFFKKTKKKISLAF